MSILTRSIYIQEALKYDGEWILDIEKWFSTGVGDSPHLYYPTIKALRNIGIEEMHVISTTEQGVLQWSEKDEEYKQID